MLTGNTLVRTLVAGALIFALPALLAHDNVGLDTAPQRYGVFQEPLLHSGSPTVAEQHALLQAINAYKRSGDAGDTGSLELFLNAYPHSVWEASLWLNIGLAERVGGRYSAALDAFEKARKAAEHLPSEMAMRPIAERALGEELTLETLLGHPSRVAALLQTAQQLGLSGGSEASVSLAKEGLWDMQHHPRSAFECGLIALNALLRAQGISLNTASLPSMNAQSHGYNLQQLIEIASQQHQAMLAIHADAANVIPVPSVVHWKSGHFATILARQPGGYRVSDPVMRGLSFMSESAVRAESSGYFLVPKTSTARAFASYRSVGGAEAQRVLGAGNTLSNDPHGFPNTCAPCGTGAGGSSGGVAGASGGTGGDTPGAGDAGPAASPGMPSYTISPMLISLTVTDTPLSYAPPKGMAMDFTLSYNQLDVDQPTTFTYGNVGAKWTHNWLSYVQDDPTNPGSNVSVYLPSGPGRLYGGFNSTSGAFAPEAETGAQLVKVSTSPVIYERRFPDGSKDVFAASDNSTYAPRHIFLSQRVDIHGNTVALSYDAQARLTTVTDALGHALTFHYGNSGQPLQLTSVSDAFGRSANLTYDTMGRLNGTTDAIGMASSFAYDTSTSITSMTTPYGTTGFVTGQQGIQRWINVTDVLGNVSRMEFAEGVSGIPYSESQVPSGINAFNLYINYRDSFYWDAQAYKLSPGDYSQAVNYHWSHVTSNGSLSAVTADDLESIKYPLENRIWYNHPGDVAGGSGALTVPSLIGRVLADGSTQLTQNTFTAQGKLTRSIDPAGLETDITYAANGIDATQIVRSGTNYNATESFTYNNQHEPLTHTDELGAVTTYTYNAAGQKTSETDPLGHVTQWGYDANGYMTSMTDANNHVTTYTYDAVGRLASKTDAANYKTSYAYDALNRLTTTTHWDNTYELETYSKLDRVSHRDRLGNVTAFVFDGVRNLITVTDPLNHVTNNTYYPNHLLLSQTDAIGGVTTWGRDIEGRVTQRTEANGGVTGFVFDTSDRLTSTTNALNQTTNFVSYDGMDRLTRTEDVNGVYTDQTFNPRGWLLSKIIRANSDGSASSADATVAMAYSLSGDMLSTTDADGVVTTNGYDAAHRLTRITDSMNNHIQYSLDGVGNATAENTFAGSATSPIRTLSRSFNVVDKVSQTQDAQGRATIYGYDGDRNLTDITDPQGILTHTNYDALDRVLSTIQNVNGLDATTRNTTTSYAYDAAGRLTSVTDPSALATSYGYDAVGHVTRATSPDSGQTIYSYDSAGRTTSKTDARSIKVSYANDLLNRRTSEQFMNLAQNIPLPSLNVSYHYDEANSATGCPTSSDPVGHLTRISEDVNNGSALTIYCYDNHGNVTSKTQSVGGVSDAMVFGYTKADRSTGPGYRSGNSAIFSHDANGRISGISVRVRPAPGVNPPVTATPIVSSVAYLPFGPVSSYVMNDSLNSVTTRTYDGNYWLTGVASPALNLAFIRNPEADISSATDSSGGTSSTEAYTYDGLYRITQSSVTSGGSTVTSGQYSYNPTGDRTAKSGGNGYSTGSYTYASGTHRLASVGNAARVTDGNGNTTGSVVGGQTYGFAYNGRNRMSLVQANSQTVGTYILNARGERISKTAAQLTTRFNYDENAHLIGEYTATTNRDYVWMDDLPIGIIDTANSGTVGSNAVIGVSSPISFIHVDGLNTPRVVTAKNGTVSWKRGYIKDAFGEVTPLGSYTLNLRFPGQYYDQEDSLSYNVLRDYDAGVGRYAESDPIGLRGGTSTYAYAAGNPLTWEDPFGLCPKAPNNGKCLDNVNRFINAHLADATKLANSLGNGVTPAEVLATAGNETGYGGGFAPYGNYFGLHGAGPAGTYHTTGKPSVPVQMFPVSNGFFLSGQTFVDNLSPYMTPGLGSDPLAFFTVLNQHGYATGNSGYPAYMVGTGRNRGPYTQVSACMAGP